MTEQSNEQTGHKFEFEPTKIFLRYKFHIIGLVVLILVGVLASGIYSSKRNALIDQYRDDVYQFEKTTLKDFTDGKIEVTKMIDELSALYNKSDKFEGVIPTMLKSVDNMIEKSDYASAKLLLDKIEISRSLSPYTVYLIESRKAVVFEMLGDIKTAIASYEKIIDQPVKLLEKHQYFELGRLYLQTGDKKKAKVSFEFVQKQEPSDSFSKMAKVYLDEIGEVN